MIGIFFSVVKIIGFTLAPIVKFLFRCILRRKPVDPDFSGDIVLVTGAAQGLGKELAWKFSDYGGTLVLWDINESILEETRSQLVSQGRQAFAYVVDCSKREEVYQAAEKVKEEVGNVSVLVNNAGVMCIKNVLELKDQEIHTGHNVNAMAHYWMIRSFLPWMLENNYGYIVNITSIAAFTGFPNMAVYCSSKAAAFSLSESLNLELHQLNKNGISVTAVCPWHIMNTGMFQGFHTSIHWLFPPLHPRGVAGRVVRAAYNRKFCLMIPSSLIFMVLLKLLLPSKAAKEMYRLMIGFGATDNVKQ